MGELGVMRAPGYMIVVESAIGFLLFAGSAAARSAMSATWHRVAAVALVLVGAGLVYHALFTRRAIVIDVRNRLFVESWRGLLLGRNDRVRSFSEIAFVGLDYFHDRTFEEGRLASRVLKANVWIEWIDDGFRSFGSGFPADAVPLAEELHRLTDAPLRTTHADLTPTRDRWTVESGGGE